MRLKTKLVLAATGVTFTIVLVMSLLFVGELLRQRISQAASADEVLANEVRLGCLQALESGLAASPPVDDSDAALHLAVTSALRDDQSLKALMDAIVRYSQTVEDVSISDASGFTLVSTDPEAMNQRVGKRADLGRISQVGLFSQMHEVFGGPRVFDISAPLDRNGESFLVVHLGVRSTFLRAAYAPFLHTSLIFALLAGLASVIAAAVLSNVALRPLKAINDQLELLTVGRGTRGMKRTADRPGNALAAPGAESDRNTATEIRVAKTIDRLEQQMRTTEEGYSELQSNLNQMLDTLRDGVLLFTADRETGELRAAMVSDAVAHFVAGPRRSVEESMHGNLLGKRVEDIFTPGSALAEAVFAGFHNRRAISGKVVVLEDGRKVQISIDPIDDGQGTGATIGTLLTLRDIESALHLEQELEVSRRLAAIGRITAGVGHEVKNPINAMVLHLELLRSKLAAPGEGGKGAERHVEILSSEMQRLDRVVQTLADFTRPMELQLRLIDLRDVITSVAALTSVEMRDHNTSLIVDTPHESVMVYVDADLIRQALLNLVLNAMQAMEKGGQVKISLRRETHVAVIEVADQGTGIAEAMLPRIFDLYFTTKKTGTGIGLATTFRIVQMHGGKVEVQSVTEEQSPKRGSIFTLRLPVSVAGQSRQAATERDSEAWTGFDLSAHHQSGAGENVSAIDERGPSA